MLSDPIHHLLVIFQGNIYEYPHGLRLVSTSRFAGRECRVSDRRLRNIDIVIKTQAPVLDPFIIGFACWRRIFSAENLYACAGLKLGQLIM